MNAKTTEIGIEPGVMEDPESNAIFNMFIKL